MCGLLSLFKLRCGSNAAQTIDDMIERNSVRVTMHDVDPTALRQLIEYTYSGEITITEDNVQVCNNTTTCSTRNERRNEDEAIYATVAG